MIPHTYTTALHSALVILISFHSSHSCAEWKIVNPPIVFGQTARLSCLVELKTNNYSTPTWTGGANYSTIAFHGSTADKKKYRVTNIHRNDRFESVLEIFNFRESDVNCDYSCSFGFHENRKRLRLTEEHFVFPIEPKTTTVLSTMRNGHLDIILELRKVYPVPKCQVLLNEEEVTNRVKTHVRMNGIFYSMNETLHHFGNHEACSVLLTISCNMGVKNFSVYKKALNTCTGVTVTANKEHPRSTDSNVYGGSIAVVILFLICAVALVAISKYSKLKEILCCRLSWREENIEREIPLMVQASKQNSSSN
ncbi:uncharacterized protein LOC127725782 isoform X2 [Mytilus californianus]|uniref:uncharacterized protein LOC127725782 isoform X2 n=1 Tax=Mytilus californianus TaxID=6549 RepID=UPI002245F027|nr:uncharacterized protein LOC127725782 isoform X2 [Mytilus californianus]